MKYCITGDTAEFFANEYVSLFKTQSNTNTEMQQHLLSTQL